MKLKFDSGLEYQRDAINAVVDLFEGIALEADDLEVIDKVEAIEIILTGTANNVIKDEDLVLGNLRKKQVNNNLQMSDKLIANDDYTFPNFSVEMETGTGKTYVYLRSIFELNQKYGFKKFIIVVPSIAIREGVLASINIMKEHFKGLYDNVPYDYFVYNSKELSKVRQFALNNAIQIMIINIQAFQKDAGDVDENEELIPSFAGTTSKKKKLNIIHQEQDKMSGRKPIEFIQATNPILIIDEPQSVDTTPKSKRAISTLNPLFCFRYSATHLNQYNLTYKLDPIQAYDSKLVKQIAVASIKEDNALSESFIRIDEIGYGKDDKRPHAKVTILDDSKNGTKHKQITLKHNTDVSKMTSHSGYEGFTVESINAEEGLGYVRFTNGKMLRQSEESGGLGDDILKTQIKLTVEEHFKNELRLIPQGIKVLSLFFIDRVANYRFYDEQGLPCKGKIAEWFEEAYIEFSTMDMFRDLNSSPVELAHDGYFSADKKKGIIVALVDSKGDTKADEDTYELIMRDKERLLSLDEPLRFIFSHSALKEGWDNPNVFQICSLREMGTERERRQTLGRGLRLAVNQDGERVFDETVNKLTVIASESFEEYAQGLQNDIERDCQIKFGRIEKHDFAGIVDGTNAILGQEKSSELWKELVENGYLNHRGDVTDKFTPEKKGFSLHLSKEFSGQRAQIIDEIKRHIFKSRIVNARDRKTLKYNKRIELNEDFQVLWNKINQKTRYQVQFSTDKLIEKAAEYIKKMDDIKPAKLIVEKTKLNISEAGLSKGTILNTGISFLKAKFKTT